MTDDRFLITNFLFMLLVLLLFIGSIGFYYSDFWIILLTTTISIHLLFAKIMLFFLKTKYAVLRYIVAFSVGLLLSMVYLFWFFFNFMMYTPG